jgi:hypothetical protein
MIPTALIDTHALLKMVYASLAAGVGVAVIFAVALLGAIRSSDMRRARHAGAAAAFAALAAVGVLVCCAAVVYGLTLVARKT